MMGKHHTTNPSISREIVGKGIWFYSHDGRLTESCHSSPSLVILCSWTGACDRHIDKYVKTYQKTLLADYIMVITTSAKDFILRSSRSKQKRLQPAVDRLETLKQNKEWRGALMHVFSEGGSHKACEFAMAYHMKNKKPLPVSAVCLDSTPGVPRFWRLCNAMARSISGVFLLRTMAYPVAFVAVGSMWITYHAVLGFENNPVSRTREYLLNETYFDKTVPRCYLYSTEDKLVGFEDVKAHAKQSLTTKIPVMQIHFTSQHVQHARYNADQYWGAVQDIWTQRSQEAGQPPCAVGEKKDWHA